MRERRPRRRMQGRARRPRSSGGLNGAGPAQQQRNADQRRHDAESTDELGDAEGSEHQRVGPQRLGEDTTARVQPHVAEEQGARRFLAPTTQDANQEQEDAEIPQRLVEERGMEEFAPGVRQRSVRGRDVELPGQLGRSPECFLVEEVAPAPDRLSDGEARRRHVEIRSQRETARPRIPAPDEHAGDHATVDGQPSFPHCEDFRRQASIIVEVEQDVIEPGADEAPEQSQLGSPEERFRVESAAERVAMGEDAAADVRQLKETRQTRIAAAKLSLQEAKSLLTEVRSRAQSLEAAQKKAYAQVKEAEKQKREAEERLEEARAASKDAARRARTIAIEVEEAAKAVEHAKGGVEKASKELELSFREK